ncbi:expressed protein [Echinococcus multilocularis]|uniref:Expressed protein n=1 Tax=Echinococcus multilocularis TaxID=6211 RepID=A0A068YH85_ECHMU|nr:expressed protein [Echinococcus multilocularis]
MVMVAVAMVVAAPSNSTSVVVGCGVFPHFACAIGWPSVNASKSIIITGAHDVKPSSKCIVFISARPIFI